MRARLLDSAMSIVATKGPAAASIEDIVAGVSASRGRFYKYFEDRPPAASPAPPSAETRTKIQALMGRLAKRSTN